MTAEESRTFSLDRQLVHDLTSRDMSIRSEALSQIPEALSRQEISDIGIQVSIVPGVEAIKQGEKLEKETILTLGCYALISNGDLVTASNACRELLSRHDLIGWFMLAKRLRQAKR